ncbi:hypothetical protein [Polaribacter butkevichii]|uniref:DUF4136 domain-containing protein n=1 Tax=Polaribacter butkevichii TaxID=218490 RepID=A0A2P6CB70_9FLAO|nr:hypothetical protein [Polaribacter butkevichii]PQJ72163.1 hypothetical protein BTO14_02370 [Polaribacter butkevichii]
MKRKSVLIIVFFTILFSLSSCKVNKQYVQYISKKEDIKTPETKKVIVFATDDVRVNNFKKTFEKNFPQKVDFTFNFMNEFSEKGFENNLFSNISIDRKSFKYDDLNTENSDYVIYFSNFEISNRVEWNSTGAMGMNGMGMNTSTSVEYCVINVKVEIYDAKNGKEILDFVVIGGESVFMFDFTKTFNKAKERAVQHIINYLKTGKTEYKKY